MTGRFCCKGCSDPLIHDRLPDRHHPFQSWRIAIRCSSCGDDSSYGADDLVDTDAGDLRPVWSPEAQARRTGAGRTL